MSSQHQDKAFMLSARSVSRLYRTCQIVLVLAVTTMLAGLLWNHYNLIFYPTLLDYNEAAMPAITETILSGGSPYSLESQPAQISVYPVLYNYIVAPFALYFDNTLEIHRLVVGFFVVASVTLCLFVTRSVSGSTVSGMASAAMFYAGLLYYSTPIASPNSVGLFFFLVSIVAPWHGSFSSRSLVYSLIAGVLAFYGKQYFIACLGYVSLYLFLFVSKRKAILFGFSSAVVFAVSLYFVQNSFPYFLDNTVFAVKQATSIIGSTKTVIDQLVLFMQTYLGLLLLLLAVFARAVYLYFSEGRPAWAHTQWDLNFKSFAQPFFPRPMDYFWFCFICSLGIVVFVLGRNPANKMTYLFQLMAPFLLISTFSTVARFRQFKWLALPFILHSLYTSYTMLPGDFTVDEEGWSHLSEVLEGEKQVYATPIALPLLVENGSEIFNNGHTVYFYFSRSVPQFLEKPLVEERSVALWDKHVDRIHKNIREKKFDLIVLDTWTKLPEKSLEITQGLTAHQLLKKHYVVSEKISVALAHRPGGGSYSIKVWKPKQNDGH